MLPKVLLVDDDPRVTAGLRRTLRGEPYEVLVAQSGEEALLLLASTGADVLVSDEQMPGMSGSELVTSVRKLHPAVVRIILTGQATVEAAMRAVNGGEIYRFLTKPCDPESLKEVLRTALEEKDVLAKSLDLRAELGVRSEARRRLERAAPGITSVRRDRHGRIQMDDDEPGKSSKVS